MTQLGAGIQDGPVAFSFVAMTVTATTNTSHTVIQRLGEARSSPRNSKLTNPDESMPRSSHAVPCNDA